MNLNLLQPLNTKEKTEELGIFIRTHIKEFQGEAGKGHPIPRMLFAHEKSARAFVDELSRRFKIPASQWIFVTATSERIKGERLDNTQNINSSKIHIPGLARWSRPSPKSRS
jgi:hypothetical protein